MKFMKELMQLNEDAISTAKAEVAKAKKDLADMPSNPQTQAGYDALDDAKADLKKAQAKLEKLLGKS